MNRERLIPPALFEYMQQWCKSHRMGEIVLKVYEHRIVSGQMVEPFRLVGHGDERELDTFLDKVASK
jgi:hypothetical protein